MTTLHLSATRPASGKCLVCGVNLVRGGGSWWLRNTWTELVEDFHEGESCAPGEVLTPCGPTPKSEGKAA